MELNKVGNIYVNLEEKVYARIPSASNINIDKQDNSLYMGAIDNEKLVNCILDLFDLKDLDELNNFKVELKYNDLILNSVYNLNRKNNQIQNQMHINDKKSGICIVAKNYSENEKVDIVNDKLYIFIDLKNRNVFFSKVKQINNNTIEFISNDLTVDEDIKIELEKKRRYLLQFQYNQLEFKTIFQLEFKKSDNLKLVEFKNKLLNNNKKCKVCDKNEDLMFYFKDLKHNKPLIDIKYENIEVLCERHFCEKILREDK